MPPQVVPRPNRITANDRALPTGFEPESDIPEGFVPEGFTEETSPPQSEGYGTWLSRIFSKEPPKINPQAGQGHFETTGGYTEFKSPYKPPVARPDTGMYGIDEKAGRELGYSLSNRIANNPNIPDWLKPQFTMWANELFIQAPQAIADLPSAPENVIGMFGIGRPKVPFEVPPGRPLPGVKFPIEEPLPPRPPAKMLPPGEPTSPAYSFENPFIGGPGGLQRQNLLRPQEEARLAGYDFHIDDTGSIVPGKPAVAGREINTDLGEVLEKQRQDSTFYTAHEQGGGTALELPDNERYLRGTELGFEPVSRAGTPTGPAPAIVGEDIASQILRARSHPPGVEPLEYPLNVVPEAVRPRSTQEVTRALAPRSMQEPVAAPRDPFVFESVKPPEIPPRPQEPDLAGGTAAIRPGEEILPSRNILTPKKIQQTKKAAKNTGLPLDPEKIAALPESIQVPIEALIDTESKLDSPWKAVYTQLEDLSPTLTMAAKRSVQFTRQYLAQWVPDFENAIGKLTTMQRQNFGAYAEGSVPINDPKLQNAVNIWKTIESAIGDKATSVGLRLYTDSKKWVPFMKNTENYWPHIPTEKVGVGFKQKLIDSGLSIAEAERVEKYFRRASEIVVGAQHARAAKSNIPYRLDADAGVAHIYSMSKRIAQHEQFGPLDVAGHGSEGIADVIKATKDPNLANKLMSRIIGRDEVASAQMTKYLDRARQFSAIAHLKNFTIPNIIMGQSMNVLKGSRYPIASLKEVAKLLGSRYRGEMAKSGVWQAFSHTMAEDLGKLRDPYLIGSGEVFNRGIAGAIGKAVAKEAHKDLRANFLKLAELGGPSKSASAKLSSVELSDLLQEDVGQLARQDKLTEQQLNMAAGRMAEITQGLNVPGNLPYWASEPVNSWPKFAAQLVLQFKKMGFQATKNVWDSIDPRRVGSVQSAKNAALWIGVSQVAGEMIGDLKAGVRSLWTQDDELTKRNLKWLDQNGITGPMLNEAADAIGIEPEVLARMLDNASNAFLLGLPADMLMSSTYGPAGLASYIVGPTLSDAAKALYYSLQSVSQGTPKPLVKEGMKMLPVPGAEGIPQAVFGED